MKTMSITYNSHSMSHAGVHCTATNACSGLSHLCRHHTQVAPNQHFEKYTEGSYSERAPIQRGQLIHTLK